MSPTTPVPSTTLQIGDRTLVVEATPLARSRRTRLGIIVDQPQAGTLRVNFHGVALAVSRLLLIALFFSLILPVIIPAIILFLFMGPKGLADIDIWMAGLVLGVPAGLTGVALLFVFTRKPRMEFDQVTRQVRSVFAGRLPGVGVRILAVQLVPGRVDEDLRGPSRSLQLNLILDTPEHPRVGFITYRDLAWTRNAGRTLADYLGVPLVDQIPAEE